MTTKLLAIAEIIGGLALTTIFVASLIAMDVNFLIVAKILLGVVIASVIISLLFLIVMIVIGEILHHTHHKTRRAEKKERDRLDLFRQIEQDKLREESEMDAWLSDISDGGKFNTHMQSVCDEYRRTQRYIKTGEDYTDGVL